MTTAVIIRLTLQFLVFLVWAFCMFKMLFDVRRIAAGKTGSTFPGPVSFLSAMGEWGRAPATRPWRNLLLFLTVVLFAMIGSGYLLAGG
jgi:hypothetical protein